MKELLRGWGGVPLFYFRKQIRVEKGTTGTCWVCWFFTFCGSAFVVMIEPHTRPAGLWRRAMDAAGADAFLVCDFGFIFRNTIYTVLLLLLLLDRCSWRHPASRGTALFPGFFCFLFLMF